MKNILKLKISFILGALFLTLFFVIPSKAASYDFSPASGQLNSGCINLVQVIIDTQGSNSNAADLEISFNPSQIEIIDQDSTTPGIQVLPGDVYESFVYNEANNATGKIIIAAGSYTSTFNGKDTFLTIKFKPKAGATSGSFNIKFSGAGNTIDSNIAETNSSLDLLTSVTNGNYTFASSNCINDTEAPNIDFVFPQNGDLNVETDEIEFKLEDLGSGVDVSTLKININGIEYNFNDPAVTITGTPGNYIVKVKPIGGISADEESVIFITVDDLAGNTASNFITFNSTLVNLPDTGELEFPLIIPIVPKGNGAIISPNESLQVRIKDDGDGINLNNVIFTLNGRVYTINDPEVSYTGEPNDYLFTITPAGGLEDGEKYILTVFATDNLGNPILETYTFETSGIKDCTCSKQNYLWPVSEIESWLLGSNFVPNIIKNLIQDFGLLTLLAAVLALLLSTLGIPLLLALLSGLLMSILPALFTKPNKLTGLIYDKERILPIRYARIEIFTDNKRNKLYKALSDIEGRYGIELPSGKYFMKVSYLGYVLHEEKINLTNRKYFHLDVALSMSSTSIPSLIANLINILYKFVTPLLALGITFSYLGLYMHPVLPNALLAVVFTILTLIHVHNKIRTQRNWGKLLSNSRFVANIKTRIFDTDGSLSDTLISSGMMNYGFPENPKGDYEFEIDSKYAQLDSTQKKVEVSRSKAKITNTKKNKVDIKVAKK